MKLVAIDVMASKKVVSALVLYPVQSLCSTLLVYIGLKWFLPDVSAGLWAVVFFVLWPLYSYCKCGILIYNNLMDDFIYI